MKARLVRRHTENISKNIISFWFEPEHPLKHIAGQYIELTLQHHNHDDRGVRRWFTVSSSPTDSPLMSITTKFSSPGSTFKQSLHSLHINNSVNISEPMGDFVLPKDNNVPLIFIAGGIGITPFHSIVQYLYDTKQVRDITFLYSVNNEHEMVFQDLFEKYGMSRTIILSQPTGQWTGQTGQLTGERVLELTKPTDNHLLYISGPEPMVEGLTDSLEKLGINKAQLIGDFFPGYPKTI